MLTYVLALLAACANATSSVLQRKANRRVPRKQNMTLRQIASLLHQPVWFGGVLAVTAGFVLQAAALAAGELAVVEPVLVLELPATLLLASRVFGSRLHLREWGAAAVMSAALAGLLYCLAPSSGRAQGVPWYAWAAGAGLSVAVIAALVAWGRTGPAAKGSGTHRAAVLGVATGAGFGLTAALMKGMTTTYAHGLGAVFTSWQLYAMIVSGVLSMFLLQSAVNAGRLLAAQPGLTLSDPIVSILWGALVFRERLRGGWLILPEVACGLGLAAAVVVLARSPLLSHDTAEEPPARRPAPARHS